MLRVIRNYLNSIRLNFQVTYLNMPNPIEYLGDYNVPKGGPREGLNLKSVLLMPNKDWFHETD